MKKAQAQRHDCCHEAGHAVAGVINGDKLVLVVAYADAPMSENQRALYETATRGKSKRGATLLKRSQPNCSCGGRVECNAISMFRRRFYPGNPLCERCLDFVIKEVAAILAGGVATRIVMQGTPHPLELREDGNDLSTYLIQFDDKQRAEIRDQANSLAEKWIEQGKIAVLAVTDALQVQGVLDGIGAERIIRQNLSSTGKL